MDSLGITLDRPLVFFDLETTGTNIQTDHIVEISMVKIFPDGKREVRTRRINPGIPIPPESTAIHGISDEDVKDKKTFKFHAENLLNYLEGCDLGGYNLIGFDVPMLKQEFQRVGFEFDVAHRRIIDSFAIFKKMSPRNLTAAYRFYCGKDLENAHSAEADILATVDVFEGQIKMYSNTDPSNFPKGIEAFPDSIEKLHDFCNKKPDDWIDSNGRFKWSGNRAIVAFGVNNGKYLEDIAVNNPKFLQWIIRSNFPEDTTQIARDALQGKFPTIKTP